MSEIAIRVEGLGKRYRIGAAAERHRDFRDAVTAAVKAPFRNLSRLRSLSRFDGDAEEENTFWALKDVSFEVKQGEVLGIIGRNGAGKSTLLKILSRITEPTTGRVQMHGRVGALLEVGTGFHAELTGRENVYLNGSILGMDKEYIDRKFDQIVDFSGVEKFIDTPVKRYSSGMYLRLAFSVAAHMEPEILVVDEVLAVGDAEFQKKCLGKMGEVAGAGRTVLFVSHNMAAVESLCQRCIGLAGGSIVIEGEPAYAIREYLSDRTAVDTANLLSTDARRGAGSIRFSAVELIDDTGSVASSARTGQDLQIRLSFAMAPDKNRPVRARISIAVGNSLGQFLWICSTEMTYEGTFFLQPNEMVTCSIPSLPLTGGSYNMVLYVEADGVIEDWIDGLDLTVDDADFFGLGKNCPSGWEGKGVLVRHSWEHSST